MPVIPQYLPQNAKIRPVLEKGGRLLGRMLRRATVALTPSVPSHALWIKLEVVLIVGIWAETGDPDGTCSMWSIVVIRSQLIVSDSASTISQIPSLSTLFVLANPHKLTANIAKL